MPYTMDNLPESMKGAPKHAVEIFMAAFNTAFEKSHVEGAAMAIAMAAVHKAGYKLVPESLNRGKDEKGKWINSSPHPPSKGGEMSPAGGGAGGGSHAESSPFIPLQRGTEWIPIFRTGTHTDSNGNEKTWTEAELDMIVQKYRPQEHEAPAVIGHPEHNSPAWGWVEGLKREGNVLFGKFKGLVPEFVNMVRKGIFKKRSISLYPDMTLRHVGFLGGMAPAVKGLPDVAFQDGEGQIIEFNFDCKQCNRCNTNNFCVGAENLQPLPRKEAKGMKWFDWLKGKASAEGVVIEDNPPPAPASGGQYSSPPGGDIKTLVDAEVAKVVAAKTSEFAETQRSLDAEKERLKAEGEKLEKAKGERMKDEIKSFCEGLCKDGGRITPAMRKYGMGMDNFLEAISGIQTQYDFCEPTEGKKLTPAEHMKGFLSCFKKQIEFSEFAGADKDIPRGGNAGEKLSALTKKKMDEKKTLTYGQAFSEAQSENPDLAKQYAAEIGK